MQQQQHTKILLKSVQMFLRYDFFKFSRWQLATVLNFKKAKFYIKRESGGPRHVTMPNFVKNGRSIVKICIFSFIQDGSRLPSWICLDTHGEHSVVSITVQNLLYDWCSSVDNMNILIPGAFGWKMPIYAHKIGDFGAIQKAKRHTLAWVRIISAIKHKNLASSLSVGESL